MYIAMGDYDNAFTYYKLGEQTLAVESTAIAKVYAAHLTSLFDFYGDPMRYTDAQKNDIYNLFDEAKDRVPNIDSNSTWTSLKVKVGDLREGKYDKTNNGSNNNNSNNNNNNNDNNGNSNNNDDSSSGGTTEDDEKEGE